jgi:hypothetical protein
MKKFLLLSLSTFLVLTNFTTSAALTDGLVSYWPMDGTNGPTTPDVCSTNILSTVGPLAVISSPRNNALVFNGSSTYLTNLHSFDRTATGMPIYTAGSYTIMMWVKGANQTAKYLYTEGNTTTTGPIVILQTGNAAASNNKLDIILRNDQGTIFVNHLVSQTVVFDNNWHHIAWADNFGSVKLYVDGVLDGANFNYNPGGTMTVNSSAVGTLVRTTVATANIFNGQMDDLAIWERALSQTEVNQVRTNGIPTPIVPTGPQLISVPADAVKHVGDWHLFSVTASSVPHKIFSYQWSRNGTPIDGGTNRTYQAVGLTTSNTGDYYSVVVSNDVNSVTTTNATLTVLPDPAPDTLSGLVDYWPLDNYGFDGSNTFTPELHYGQNFYMYGMNDTNDFNVDPGSQIVPGATNAYGTQFSNAVYCLAGFPTFGVKTNGAAIYAASNYSVCLWVNANGIGQSDRRVFSEGFTGTATPLFTLGTDNTGLTPSATVFVRSDANVNAELVGRKSARNVFDGNWHHLAWTDASGKGKLYVDGTLDEQDYTYTRPSVTVNITSIGGVVRSNGVSNASTGYIDEVATWNRVLSWTEIQAVISNGIPAPPAISAPSMVTQPANQTNGNIYVGDNATFSVQANGTLPLDYHWRQNGANMDGVANPSALTTTLTLSNVQAVLSNASYSVVITNAAGAVTSSVAKLYVIPYTPAATGTVLALDFGSVSGSNPMPGFNEMTLAANPAVFNTLRVTVSLIGAGPLTDRLRSAAPWVVNNPPYLTQAQIYNDFMFNDDTSFANGNGLRVLIEHLAPGTNYGVTIWSYDSFSSPDRISDWSETASGTPVTIQTGYDFVGSTIPTDDFQDTLGGLLTASPDGKLQFEGVRDGGTSFGVFINAIRLVANPKDRTRVMRGAMVNGNLRITAVGEYPGQTISIQQSADLVNGPWVDAVGGTFISVNGMVSVYDFPIDPNQPQLFYRGHP